MTIRLFIDAPLKAGASVPLSREQAHYVLTVMRLGDQADVRVFNGADGEWAATLLKRGKRDAFVDLTQQTREQEGEAGPWLLFAPVKRAQTDFIVQKATELGASALWPVFTARTESQTVRLDRMRTIAQEAAEQCERLTVPDLKLAAPLKDVLQTWPQDRALLVLAERGEAVSLADFTPDSGHSGHALVSGPEGGFEDKELDALRQLPFVTFIGLGPRVLRAETAALAALASWQMIHGDGRARPAGR